MRDESVILVKLMRAWNLAWEGLNGPLAGSEPEKDARYALRRWRSFHRRHHNKHFTYEQRVDDLAKGLCDNLHPFRIRGGGTLGEYRYLAGKLAEVMRDMNE